MLTRTGIVALFAIWPIAAHADTELKIVTHDGYVAFAVADHWPVISTATDLPVIAAVFQLPNSADAGTPDSTNLAIRFFDLSSEKARREFKRAGAYITGTPPTRESFQGWSISRQRAIQGATEYSIVDAKRELETLSVAVRLAWPNLSNNPPSYSDDMDRTLHSILASVRQHVGPWQPAENETVRRRTP